MATIVSKTRQRGFGPSREADHACAGCGYGVRAGRAPRRCPRCGGRSWRLSASRPAEGEGEPPAGTRIQALQSPLTLELDEDEREALLTVLYVVRDNWWLSDTEERFSSGWSACPQRASRRRPEPGALVAP
jgi:hypothetical protein